MEVFFCHASDDKATVEQIFERVVSKFPDVKGWLDKYEIVAGNDLIDKIAEGIESSDKFLIFLSENSIEKPWVKAELRKALMAEIEGVKPDFIVPVKLGRISKFPAFIESKKYIDLEELTEEEWLREIEGAIRGVSHAATADVEDNLQVWTEQMPDRPDTLAVVFRARYWAEPVSFHVTTTAPIIERNFHFQPPVMALIGVQTIEDEKAYGVRLQQERLSGDRLFAMTMKFPPGTDLNTVITGVQRLV